VSVRRGASLIHGLAVAELRVSLQWVQEEQRQRLQQQPGDPVRLAACRLGQRHAQDLRQNLHCHRKRRGQLLLHQLRHHLVDGDAQRPRHQVPQGWNHGCRYHKLVEAYGRVL